MTIKSKYQQPTWKRNGISLAAREDVKKRYAGRCAYCGCAAHPITIDHVVPKKRKTIHKVWNLVPACEVCNASKKAMSLDEFREALQAEWSDTWSPGVISKLLQRYDRSNAVLWMDTDEAYRIRQGWGDPNASTAIREECRRIARERREAYIGIQHTRRQGGRQIVAQSVVKNMAGKVSLFCMWAGLA